MHSLKISKLPEIMSRQGITVEKLTELTGLSKQTIIRLRRNQIEAAKIKTLQRVAEALGITVDDLFNK